MKLNRTLSRALDLLELVANEKNGYNLKELSELMDIPKTSCFDILKTLEQYQMLRFEEGTSRYLLGLKTLSLGRKYLNTVDFIQEASPYLAEISNKLQKTAFLGTLRGQHVIYLNHHYYDGDLNIKVDMGTLKPVYCTGLGKAILASYSPKELLEVTKDLKFEKSTEFTITNTAQLFEDLQATRERKYAIDNQELSLSILCFAAPIYDSQNEVIAAISASGMLSSWQNTEEAGQIVVDAALRLSKKLGYTGNDLYLENQEHHS